MRCSRDAVGVPSNEPCFSSASSSATCDGERQPRVAPGQLLNRPAGRRREAQRRTHDRRVPAAEPRDPVGLVDERLELLGIPDGRHGAEPGAVCKRTEDGPARSARRAGRRPPLSIAAGARTNAVVDARPQVAPLLRGVRAASLAVCGQSRGRRGGKEVGNMVSLRELAASWSAGLQERAHRRSPAGRRTGRRARAWTARRGSRAESGRLGVRATTAAALVAGGTLAGRADGPGAAAVSCRAQTWRGGLAERVRGRERCES